MKKLNKMKIKLIIFACIACMIGCTMSNIKKESTEFVVVTGLAPLSVITVDGCEYLYGPWKTATVLTHKGNCKNAIHYSK